MGSSATDRGSSSRCRVKVVRCDVTRLVTGCLLVVLGACGAGTAPADGVTPDPTTSRSTVALVESTSSAPPPIGDDAPIVPDPAHCVALASVLNMYAAEDVLIDNGFSDSAMVITSQYEAYRATLLDVRISAPEEIGADIDLMVDAVDLSLAALEAADFDLSEAEAPYDASMSESLEAAVQRVSEYAETECGVPLETCSGERATLETAIGAYHYQRGAYPAGVEDLVGNGLREPPRYYEVHGDGVIVARPGGGCE